MKRIFSTVFLLIFVIFSYLHCVMAEGNVPKPVMEASNSVVRILAEYPEKFVTGSGFVIKSDSDGTLIATNHHVVEGNPIAISVWINADETVSAHVLAASERKDLCILELAYPLPIQALYLEKDGAAKGEAVYAVGFPAAADDLSDTEAHYSAEATVTDGIVSAIRYATISDFGDEVGLLQINAAINHGNSGGPLFNAKGHVVGINTLKADNSEGIFGAIAIGELLDFMMDNQIAVTYSEMTSRNSHIILYIGVAGFLIAAVLLWLVFKNRKKQKHTSVVKRKKKSKKSASVMTLQEFMEARGNPLTAYEAVSLLMPAAIQLRDLHDAGKVCLQIAPGTVTVADGTAFLPIAEGNEAMNYTSGYAAPEVYRGRNSGNRADIYSFCALLVYTITGEHPENALERAETDAPLCNKKSAEGQARKEFTSDEAETAQRYEEEEGAVGNTVPEDFYRILEKGAAIDAEDRFETVQMLIYKLAPYNTGEKVRENVSSGSPKDTNVEKKAPKSSKRKVKYVIVGLLLLAVITLATAAGVYYMKYNEAVELAKAGAYSEAEKTLLFPWVTEYHDAELDDYIHAGMLLENRRYSEAQQAFLRLGAYRDAASLEKESRYRRAAQLADMNQFEEAIAMYTALQEESYKDAESLILDTEYKQAAYWLYETEDYEAAYHAFASLGKHGYDGADDMASEAMYLWACDLIDREEYFDAYEKLKKLKNRAEAKELLADLTDYLYTTGQTAYRAGSYQYAKKCFTTVSTYADSNKYLTLIEVATATSYDDAQTFFDQLCDWIGFEDTGTLLALNSAFLEKFLLGEWESYDGRHYLKVNSDGIRYNLPVPDYGTSYAFHNGILVFLMDLTKAEQARLLDWYGRVLGKMRIIDVERLNYERWASLQKQRNVFSISIVSRKTIVVYCYADQKTYVLFRQ